MRRKQLNRIVLVDDDELFRESLGLTLMDQGYDVLSFGSAAAALAHLYDGGQADAIILDWRMPGMDGMEALRHLRADGISTPVVFLTVLSDETYEEAALAGGAVDFVEKSRSLSILMRRLRLIVDKQKGPVGEPDAGGSVVRVGELQLRLDVARAFWRGERVDLTLTEFNIVKQMAVQPDVDVSYRDLYDLVHGKGFVAGCGASGYRANVRAFIKRIRQKFRAIDPNFGRIENYAGFGYRWGTDDQDAHANAE